MAGLSDLLNAFLNATRLRRSAEQEKRRLEAALGKKGENQLAADETGLNPLLAKRLTELESTMAQMAKAHSAALRERAQLRSEVERLKDSRRATGNPTSPEADPEPELVPRGD